MVGRGGRGRRRDIYEGLPSDAQYKKTAHKRAIQGTIRRWLFRLFVLAAIGLAAWLWGEDLLRAVRVETQQREEEFRRGASHIEEGRDRRSGVDWIEGE